MQKFENTVNSDQIGIQGGEDGHHLFPDVMIWTGYSITYVVDRLEYVIQI